MITKYFETIEQAKNFINKNSNILGDYHFTTPLFLENGVELNFWQNEKIDIYVVFRQDDMNITKVFKKYEQAKQYFDTLQNVELRVLAISGAVITLDEK